MISSKIPVQNKNSAGSLIPVRCYKSTDIKNNQPQAKSSVQISLLSEGKRLQRDCIVQKSTNLKKPNRLPTSNHRAVEKANINKNLKIEKKQANKIQPEPTKLSNRPSKPVPIHQRKLSTISVCTKEAKSCNVKKSQVQPEPPNLNSRLTNPTLTSVPQRKLSSVNTQSTKISKSQVLSVSQKGNKITSQQKSKPLKETQILSNENLLKRDGKPNLSKKDKNDMKKNDADLLRLQSSNAHNLPILPKSIMSNKENVNTLTEKEVKQITENLKIKVKKKEGSKEIQPTTQKPGSDKDLKLSKSTEMILAQCVDKEEFNQPCLVEKDNDVNDLEFKNSGFYKSLILSERELSPGIIKFCSESKVSSFDLQAYSKPPLQKFWANYTSQEDFLEDLRRNSSNFQRRKGNSPIVPGMKSPAKKYLETFSSVNDFVEDLRRNSVNIIKRRETLQASSFVKNKQCKVKNLLGEYSSVNDLVEDVRRNSANFIKKGGRPHYSPFQNTPYVRRWTCNAQSSSGIKNINNAVKKDFFSIKRFPVQIPGMKSSPKKYQGNFSSVNDIVEDLKRNSKNLIRRRETLQNSPFSIINSVSKYPKNILNSQPSALKGSETSKRKEKIKKKVTFYISPTSSESTPFSENLESEKIKTIVKKIPGQISQNSTPELEANVYRDKETPVNAEDSKDKSNNSTPEFNLEALKIIPKDNEKENILSAITPKIVIETVECPIDNNSPDLRCGKPAFNSSTALLSVNPSNCKSLSKNVETILHPNQNSIHCKNTVEQKIPSSIYNKQYASEGQTAIVRPMKQLCISSDNNSNETGAFTVRTEKSIFTPLPVSLYSNSYLVNSISPPILADRSSILNTHAPICTPLVLKSMSQKAELSPVRQRLNFEEFKLDRRESQICLENIPTNQKMNDYLCDQECCMLSLLTSDETFTLNRNLVNPIADILNNGDEMHFVPLTYL